jgi:hypothetical protein
MSGANAGYGFYAPEVGSSYRTNFLLQDAQGTTWLDSFEQVDSPEARLRFVGIVESAFGSGAAETAPDRRGRLVKSWAATMFARHPSARSLAVVVEAYDVPTMAEYRAGQRPCWNIVYSARVERDSHAGQERTTQ